MRKPVYCDRTYRNHVASPGLVSFQVAIRESDLYISAAADLSEIAQSSLYRYRSHIENYINLHPVFKTSLSPVPENFLAPKIVREMISAAVTANVGPMAAVAGAVAEFVGRDLLRHSPEVIVENGGDIYLNCQREIRVGLFAGTSRLSNKLHLIIKPPMMPVGVCTSSGTVGPSFSFGTADAVCVTAKSAALADAAASHIGNRITGKKDIQKALEAGAEISGIHGILIIIDDHMGAWGDIELG